MCNHINTGLLAHRNTSVYFVIPFFPNACRHILYIQTLIDIGNNK